MTEQPRSKRWTREEWERLLEEERRAEAARPPVVALGARVQVELVDEVAERARVEAEAQQDLLLARHPDLEVLSRSTLLNLLWVRVAPARLTTRSAAAICSSVSVAQPDNRVSNSTVRMISS